ncbi:hypothetical protein BFG05_02535 [Campylobacter pinnipediorum subsp. pinnipediorum]|uniref:DUF4149 domain-containing protein n=1 Tax=Campylobacter pinnipediorum TaxID=1965231 RepID=UPI0009959C78|nr:DUF4149 domain-containing protein [Campylobacter pinnipediorum]OPA78106.1 hypothetical protein BFG05_02535 [Campylobacter pinnipediorum subsp. pinnipediorum]
MKSIYMFLLAFIIGIEFALGVFVAPAIFFPERYASDITLTHFQSGLIMTQIFIKYNYTLLFVSGFAVLFELINIKSKECIHVKISTITLSLINLALALTFVFYFTDFIVEAQKLGDSATLNNPEFDSIHKASKYVMKLMMIAQFLLFFMKNIKPKNNN